jgi:excisionase family DNA binding protein
MSTHTPDTSRLVAPTPQETELARESSRKLADMLRRRKATAELRVHSGTAAPETISLPTAAVRLLQSMLSELGKGNALAVLPVHEELTTQQAADLLNGSRPFVVRMLEEGKLPSRKVGTHRRVRLQDALEYKQRLFESRNEALAELADEAQKLGLGY